MKLNLLFGNEVVLIAEFDDPLQGAVVIVHINPSFQSTINQWLSEEEFILSHDEETGGYAGETNGLDDIRAFEQRVIELVHEMGEGWDYYVSEEVVMKGGAGSGNHGHAGRPGMRGGSAPEGAGKAELEGTRLPSEKTIRGMIRVKYDTANYNPDNQLVHKTIEGSIEAAVEKLPENHAALIKSIVIDDDISNNMVPMMGGREISIGAWAAERKFSPNEIGAYVVQGRDGITVNANISNISLIKQGYTNAIMHETGHVVYNKSSQDIKNAFREAFDTPKSIDAVKDLLFGNELAKDTEAFAGLYRTYITRSSEFEEKDLPLYNLYKEKIFGGVEYTAKAEGSESRRGLYIYEEDGIRIYALEPIPELQKMVKGGPGSGSWGGQGQPRFTWTQRQQAQAPSQAQQVGEVAHQISERAKQIEPKITQAIETISQKIGGMVRGKEFRVKTEESIIRKMQSDYLANPNMTPEEVGNEIRDSVRYTMEFPHEKYTESVSTALENLKAEGHEPVKVKNYWEPGDPYQGINVTMRSTEGHQWEVQFHTPESYQFKQNDLHPLYEQFRVSADPSEKKSLWSQMVDVSNRISAPAGVLAIGILATQVFKAIADGIRYFAFEPAEEGKFSGIFRMKETEKALSFDYMSKKGNWVNDPELASFLLGSEGAVEIGADRAGKLINEWFLKDKKVEKGGEGSGNYGHAGRPGEVGGSGEGGKPDISHETSATPIPEHLKTFADVKDYLGQGTKIIISAERSHLRPEENERRSIGLKRVLENYDENVVSQEGKWGGSAERSYVASVSPDAIPDIQALAFASNELDQDAFIVVQDGVAELRYRDGGIQRGTIGSLSDAESEKDNYSKLGAVKYRINFEEKP